MRLTVNIYDNVKKRKPFVIYDIVVYAAIVIVSVAFFLGIIVFPANDIAGGFKIVVDEKEIFVFYYADCRYEIKDFDGQITVNLTDGEKKFTVNVLFFESGEHNTLSVNAEEKTVEVVDADCSARKDCVYTPAIKNGSGAIYCMPHKLKILPLRTDYRPIQTGGL